jgi:hypothetical protein
LFEIASRKTWRKDVAEKRELYAQIGVREYFLFDPEARYLDPPLQGYRLKGGVYVALKPAKDGSLVSKELGLRMVPEGEMLRLVDLKTGKKILTRGEANEQLAAEVAQLQERLAKQAEQAGTNGGNV